MAQKTNSFEKFWKELKRRKVVHVITVYAAVAFVILQLVDIIGPSLKWPDWTMTFVIVLLCIGFIISVFVSWVYDITPSGVKKTKPASAVRQIDQTAKPASSGWKIATYVSAIIIVGFIVFNFISRRNLNAYISKVEKAIAVLPFRNDSRDSTNQYFINGIMEKITTNLQMVKTLRVLSRTSVEQYRNTTKSVPDIARELKVNYVLEGSGQKYGNSFSITVQLIRAKGKESHLWAKTYDQEIKEVKDYIKVQSQIAQAIAAELKTAITPEEKQLIEKTPTTSLTALDFFQRGREEHMKYWLDNTKTKALDNAISYYKLALKSDSTFAQAYTGLAIARSNYYWQDVWTKGEFSENEMKTVNDSILSLVDKALNFNKDLEEAYAVRGWFSKDFDMAIKEYRKALEINPNNGMAYCYISDVLYYGKNESIEGIKYLLKAIELERGAFLPGLLKELGFRYELLGFGENAIDIYNQLFQLTKDTLQYFQNMSGPYYNKQNWDECIRWTMKILDRDPKNYWAHWNLFQIYSYIGRDDSSNYHTEKALEFEFLNPDDFAFYKGILLWKHGDKLKARASFAKSIELYEELIKAEVNNDQLNYALAKIYSFMGEQEKALDCLNKIGINTCRQKWFIIELEVSPFFQNLRSNERFQEILNTSRSNYQKEHDKVQVWLEENNLLKR